MLLMLLEGRRGGVRGGFDVGAGIRLYCIYDGRIRGL